MPRRDRVLPFPGTEVPISDLNTTPLIDVMLVLLVMFIITVPISTHKVPLELPQGPPVTQEPVVHRLDLDAVGRISLDGTPLPDAQLPARLVTIASDPAGALEIRADAETPYDRFDRVLAVVKRAGVSKLGMVGNERFVEALR